MKLSKYLLLSVLATNGISCEEAPKGSLPPLVQAFSNPAGARSSLPYLYTYGGKSLMSWVERTGDSLAVLKYAEVSDTTWQAPKAILEAKDWFVNWADFPVIVENHGHLMTHVLKKSSAGTYSYDVKLNILPRGASKWTTDLALHTDGTASEHGFVSAMPYREDYFFVTWLDGRNTVGGDDEHRGAMTIRAAVVGVDGSIGKEVVLDDRTCDCCQTTAAMTENGPVVIYRDRSQEEVRDMSIVRWVDGQWTAPVTVHEDNWKIKGCPVNGPKAAALGNNLAVAWFTASNNEPKVQLVFSDDGGAHFDAPIRIDSSNAMGRVDLALIDKQTALISWMAATETAAEIRAVKVSRSGQISAPVVIATLDASRNTGFPQMELVGDKVYFAWTDVHQAGSQVKTAYVALDRF